MCYDGLAHLALSPVEYMSLFYVWVKMYESMWPYPCTLKPMHLVALATVLCIYSHNIFETHTSSCM